jgi:prolyl-tRNA editing enzyme YbaK/EbsC (Cys-tRNA(Pro) deacylase)
VLPAGLVVNRPRLLELAGGSEIRSAHEREEPSGSTGREAAGIVPLQPFAGLPMFVDVTLACESYVVFDSGEGSATIRMRWADLARTLRPVVGVFAEAPRDRVPAYRLSFRE